MTSNELTYKLHELLRRRDVALEGLREPAKAAVTALRDAKLNETALRLDVVLAELEVLDQELVEVAKANATSLVDLLLGKKAGG